MPKPPTGLADLALAFAALRPSREECARIAELLGLKGTPIAASLPPLPSPAPAPPRTPPPAGPDIAPVRTKAVKEVEDQAKALPPATPKWEDEPRVDPPSFEEKAEPIKLTVVRPPPDQPMPPYVLNAEELHFDTGQARNLKSPAPLIPQGQLRALVTELLAAPAPGSLDYDRIITAIALRRLPRTLPRHTRKSISPRIHLIVDTEPPMWLFNKDRDAIVDAIRTLSGESVIQGILSKGPPKAMEKAMYPGDTAVVLSSPVSIEHRDQWRKFAEDNSRRGVRLVFLVPLHRSKWPLWLKRTAKIVHWHRPGNTATHAGPSELRSLARILSLAAVIDPALLRHARMNVLPTAGAGVEADFLEAPWVAASNPRIIILHPEELVKLRTELSTDEISFRTALHLLERHRFRDPSWERVLFEEEIIALALLTDGDAEEKVTKCLGRIIFSLLKHMRNAESARWALYLIESLPEKAREQEAAQLLKAVASVILSTSHDATAEIIAQQNKTGIFSSYIRVGIRWTGQHIIVSRKPKPHSDTIIEIPYTRPLVVLISTQDKGRRKILNITKRTPAWTRSTTLPRIIKTTDGAIYQLENMREVMRRLLIAYKEKKSIYGTVKSRSSDGWTVDIGIDARLFEYILLIKGHALSITIGSRIKVKIVDLNPIQFKADVELGIPPLNPRILLTVPSEIDACFTNRQMVKGIVLDVGLSGISINVQNFRAFLPISQLLNTDKQTLETLIGCELEFLIMFIDKKRDYVFLTRKFDQLHIWLILEEAMRLKLSVRGKVVEITPTGFMVDVGIAISVPFAEMDIDPNSKSTDYMDNTYDFRVKQINWVTQKVALSRSSFIRVEMLKSLKKDMVLTGKVKHITDTKATIDLGNLFCVMHIDDMSWYRIKHPSEILTIGQEIKVIVLDANHEKMRFSLGMKQLIENPLAWDRVIEKYPVGTKVRGKVIKLLPYAAFVELEPAIEGMVHVSELSWVKRNVRPADILTLGQDIDALVIAASMDDQKISLSVRQLNINPWELIASKYPIGSIVKGTVHNLTVYGAFIEIEPYINGMIHVTDLSWTRKITHPSELLKKGEEVEALVMEIDKSNQRISLSIKALAEDPWQNIEQKYKFGDIVYGKVSKVASFGAFVQLGAEIEGLVHISQISSQRVEKVKDVLKVGQDVTVRVIKIDKAERRIGLSIKAVDYTPEQLEREIRATESPSTDEDPGTTAP